MAYDGGNEVYVFDRQGKVYLLPLVGMSSDLAKKLADSWHEFTQKVIANA